MTRGDAKRVSKARPCLVCGRGDWCLYFGPDDAPTAAICPRIESAKPVGSAGWLHRLRDDDWRPAGTIRRAVPMRPQPQDAGPIDFEELAGDFRAAVNSVDLQRLAAGLGLTVESLQRLRVGWAAGHRAWSFPMTDAAGQVLGIRLRRPNGSKFAVTGGHDGLFLPGDLPGDAGGRLLVCEGPTDTAALLDLGFDVVGRPSCTGGKQLLVELVRRRQPNEVIVVADGDGPGMRGAENLATALVAYAAAVRVITPPNGISDARQWKRAGATRRDVLNIINAAEVRQLSVQTRRRRRKHER